MAISVVIPLRFNSPNLRLLIKSVRDEIGPRGVISIFGSEADTKGFQGHPDFKLFSFSKNPSLTGHLNEVIRKHPENDLLYIESCVNFSESGWLARLQATAEKAPVVGVKAFMANGIVYSLGRRILQPQGIRLAIANLFYGSMDRNQKVPVETLDSVAGGCVYYKASLFEKIGTFDENFCPAGFPAELSIMWLEHDDMALRARDAGLSLGMADVRIVNHASGVQQLPEPVLKNQLSIWKRKWGWDPLNPKLSAIRERWAASPITARIGSRLRQEVAPDAPVDLLLITWNNLERLEITLRSLEKTRYPHARLLIFDNACNDGTAEYLAELKEKGFRYPLEIITAPVNLGFVPAFNWLLKVSTAPLLAKLDDDIELPPEWLDRLVEDLRDHPYAGAVVPKIVYFDNPSQIQFADFRMHPPWQLHMGRKDRGDFNYLAYASCLPGTCVLYRRRAFELAGPYDLRYAPSQTDDFDHMIAVRQEGFDLLYEGRVSVKHMMRTGTERHYSVRDSSNARCNEAKLFGKWGQGIFEGLELSLGSDEERRIAPDVATLPIPEMEIIGSTPAQKP